jgi:muconolactone delta-isomerase
MKKYYMVVFRLPDPMPEEFVSLIPDQRTRVNEMMVEGRMMSYSLAADRSELWSVIKAESEIDVIRLLSELPLHSYMSFDISELAFHNHIAFSSVPAFSLN